MTLTQEVTKKIIKKLLKGLDYRIEIITLINAEFLQFSIDFFKKIVNAKLNNEEINIEWYKNAFINDISLKKEEVAVNSGLNMKTISNMYNSTKKEIVIDASNNHFDSLYHSIKELTNKENEIELNLTIRLKKVSLELNVSESLIVINTLAVKRAALRGEFWSTAGKRVEKSFMQTLCELYSVPNNNYKKVLKKQNINESFEREIDFYLINNKNKHFKCEVKLMGKGNPESADAVIARDSKIFITDKLSNTNKAQLDNLKVFWVELRNADGFLKFEEILNNLKIPYSKYKPDDIDKDIEKIFNHIFK